MKKLISGLIVGLILIFVPRSKDWDAVRDTFLQSHNECAACGQTDNLNVHHIRPFHLYPELELDPDNLITLCTDGIGHTNCHLMFGHGGNFKCWNPNVRQDAANFRLMIKNRKCEK